MYFTVNKSSNAEKSAAMARAGKAGVYPKPRQKALLMCGGNAPSKLMITMLPRRNRRLCAGFSKQLPSLLQDG
jgi:hypothetical protein